MLNERQREVALKMNGNTIVSASPGTGKTKTLVARAQKKLETITKNKSLALITYTNAAADEIADRLMVDDKDVFVGTIHRFCLKFILRPFGWVNCWEQPKVISYDELLEFIESHPDLNMGDNPIEELNKIKKTLTGSLDTSVEWDNETSLQECADKFYSYLNSISAIDFNEILYRSYKLVSENDFIVDSLANKFYEISVDEFQDTNIFQYEILKSINSKGICTFFIVGDEKQKIYRFAGAIDNAFERASTDFSTEIKFLNKTYRSTWAVIRAYSALFADHPILENESKYRDSQQQLIVRGTRNGTNNNELIETIIGKLIESGIPIEDIAVLTNGWREAIAISQRLRTNYQVVGIGALPHRSINSSTFSILRALSRYFYSPSIGRLKIVKRNIEQHSLEHRIFEDEKQITVWANSLITSIQEFNIELGILDGLLELKAIFDRIFNINHSGFNEIIDAIREDELQHWNMKKYFRTLSGFDGVLVTTIHQSKGLEFSAVVLSGVNEGSIPYQRLLDRVNFTRAPITEEGLEDGRTKLYVGLSRAKQILIILHNQLGPSMFVQTIRGTIQ